MNPPPLKLIQLTKDYEKLRAVNEVSFTLKEGEIFGLLGPNGAGKTSIISVINTLETPSSGSLEVFGKNPFLEPKYTKSLTGCVPQELIHHGFFNIEEVLSFHSGYFGYYPNKAHIDYLIERLGLSQHRKKKIKELSGGMKRRLMIAKSLVHKPKLLLLDEPTAGVDIDLRTSLWQFVRELKELGTTVLLTTHYLEEAEELCDRVGVIHLGMLKEMGEPKALIEKLTFKEVTITTNHPIIPVKHPYLTYFDDTTLRFKLPSLETVGDLIAELPIDVREIKDFKIKEGKLEDAFKTIVNKTDETT